MEAAKEREEHALRMERMAELTKGCMGIPMPTFDQVYEFIRNEYLNSRFEGMNSHWPKGVKGGGSYSESIVRSYLDYLSKDGVAHISPFESRRGKHVAFDRSLRILNEDAPIVEKQYKAGSLSRPMSGNW